MPGSTFDFSITSSVLRIKLVEPSLNHSFSSEKKLPCNFRASHFPRILSRSKRNFYTGERNLIGRKVFGNRPRTERISRLNTVARESIQALTMLGALCIHYVYITYMKQFEVSLTHSLIFFIFKYIFGKKEISIQYTQTYNIKDI